MRAARYIAAILSVLWSGSVSAHENGPSIFNGNQLFEFCDGSEQSQWPNYCGGYIVGVVDGLFVPDGGWARNNICIPVGGASTHQIIDVVRNYLRAHPEVRHYTAASIISVAVKQAFPCDSGEQN